MSFPNNNPHITTDIDGRLFSNGLYREGFPSQLWETMQTLGYVVAPQYVGRYITETGINRCEVSLVIPSLQPGVGEEIRIVVTGGSYEEASDTAAWRALQQLSFKHQIKTFGAPAGVFMSSTTEVGESSSSVKQENYNDVQNMTRYMDNVNRLIESMAFSYGAMLNAANSQAQERAAMQGQVDQHMAVIGSLEERVYDLEVENDNLMQEQEGVWAEEPQIPNPPEELPDQGDSGLDDSPGPPVEPQLSDQEEPVAPVPQPQVPGPAYGWISEEEDTEEELDEMNGEEEIGDEEETEEEEPEERIFYTDNEESDWFMFTFGKFPFSCVVF